MACGATQKGWVMVERSDRMWSTGEGNGNPLQYSCHMNSRNRQNDRILKEELPRSVQFSSVAQLCLTLCDPMNHTKPGLPVHHHLPGFTQTQFHRVSDAIQPSHPLSSPFLPAPNPQTPASESFPMSQFFT